MSAPLLADLCSRCRHLRGIADLPTPKDGDTVGGEGDTAGCCAAFPDGIPDEIASGEFEHRQARAGDHGIRFEPL